MAATLIIHRAVPFARGDQSIRIWIDGKDAGMLPVEGPFVRELAPSRHTVRAWMNGGNGNKVILQAEEGEKITLTLSGTRVPKVSWWWDWILFMLIVLIPRDIFSVRGVWVNVALGIPIVALISYRWARVMRNFLKLEVNSEPVAEAA
jgi:hypothetical protein